MSSSDIYANEAKLADWVEMLIRYMQRSNASPLVQTPMMMWERFYREYPVTGADMEAWLEARHDESR